MVGVTEDPFDVPVVIGDRRLPLGEVLQGWTDQVGRLRAEAESPETSQTWGLDDFIGVVHLRSIVARAMSELDAHGQEVVAAAVEPTDLEFTEITHPDPSGEIQHVHRDAPVDSSYWWWFRAPAVGLPSRDFAQRTSVGERKDGPA